MGYPIATSETAVQEALNSTRVVTHEGISPAEDAPQSTRRGVLRIGGFLLLSLSFLVATDWLVNSGLRKVRTSSFGVFNRIMSGEVNAAVIISGSSRAMNNFDPRIVRNWTGLDTFNIGIDGSQTDMQVALLKTYLKHNRRPTLVVHSLDSFAFVTSRSGVYFPGQYLPYLSEAPIYQALRGVNGDMWKSRYLPLYGYAVEDMKLTWVTGLGGRLGWSPKEDRYLGFLPRYQHWTSEFGSLRDRSPNGIRFAIEPEGVRDVEELLRVCEDNGIPLLLVYSPVYIEMQELESNRDEIFGRFRELAQQYHAVLWDYSRSTISFDRDNFVNSEHLNAQGAAAFSTEFSKALASSGLVARN